MSGDLSAPVLAVDPGGTTGWVIGSAAYHLPNIPVTVTQWGEDRDWILFCDRAHELATLGAISALVVENWTPRPGVRTWQPEPLYIIGFLLWLSVSTGIPIHLQAVASAKAWGTPTKVDPYRRPEHGGVGKRGEGHALMALRHLLLYAKSEGPSPA